MKLDHCHWARKCSEDIKSSYLQSIKWHNPDVLTKSLQEKKIKRILELQMADFSPKTFKDTNEL